MTSTKLLPAAMLTLAFAVACHGSDEVKKAGSAGKDAKAKEGEPRKLAGQTVSVEPVARLSFDQQVAVSGEVRPREDVLVNASASGVRVLQLLADVGDYVKKGQTLARLDLSIVRAQLESASAQVGRAEAALENASVGVRLAESEYQRALSVKGTGALSDEAIEQRRAQADSARAQVALAKADLAVAKASRAEVEARATGGDVRSPESGLVIERNVRIGETVGAAPMFRLVGDGRLEVRAEVAEAQITSLKPGANAVFELPNGGKVSGRLRRAPASVDPTKRVGIALFDLAPHAGVKSGMYLRGTSALGSADGLAIPTSALAYGETGPYVFVVEAGNMVRKTPVTLGPQTGQQIIVLSGLAAGDRLATGGVAFLQDGDPITPFAPKPVEAPKTVEAPPEKSSSEGAK